MKQIRILSLYSGSTGNAFLIHSPDACILIDAGKSARQLLQSLAKAGVSPEQLDAIFLTHEHSDHISALPVFLKKHPLPIHLPMGCAYKLEKEQSLLPHLNPHPPMHTEQVGSLSVTSFPTPHDSRASVGYRIVWRGEGEQSQFCIGYATDIGYISPHVEEALIGCDAVILESNHDPEMLMFGPYPYPLKQRISSRNGHLSNQESAAFAARLCALGTKSLMLAHLSQENNTPSLALSECRGAVANADLPIVIAHPDEITEMQL